MRLKNEDIRKRILVEARKLFLERGFKETSMRAIAVNAEVVLSNIYNYFENKDAIFVEVLNPMILQLKKVITDHHNEESYTIDIFFDQNYVINITNLFVDFIGCYYEDLDLLFTKSHGSSLENFFEALIDDFTVDGVDYMQIMKEKYPDLHTNITAFFIHLVSSWFVTILREVTIHKEMTKEEIRQFVSEYSIFVTAGWKALMNVK